jgi:hypothetical protein
VCARIGLPGEAGEHSLLVFLLVCHRHLPDTRLWLERHGQGTAAVRLLRPRAAARALRQARAGQDPDRGGLLTNLGRPAP